MRATVVITSKNRREELRAAIASAVSQAPACEVLVVDDGSTDGTADMVLAEFPSVKLERVETSRGYIAARNAGAKLATGDVIFSIDDDAIFSTPNVVAQTLAEFDHPRVGAVAIPFINVKTDQRLQQHAGRPGVICGSDYIGTAHAVRRDLFLSAGGYREYLFHQGEERDLCIRLLDRGYVVRFGRADPIHHFESPRRDFRRMDLYGRRNDVLYVWQNTPLGSLLPMLAGTTIRGAMFGVKVRRPWRMVHGLWMGYAAAFHERKNRRPVHPGTFRLSRLLKRGLLPLEQIEGMLPEVQKSDV